LKYFMLKRPSTMKRQSLMTLARSGLLGAIAVAAAASGLSLCERSMVFGQSDINRISGTNTGYPATSSAAASSSPIHLSYAQFQIPFSVDPAGPVPKQIQLWVSTDEGKNWQMHGTADPEARQFPFRAAAEGTYLFSVRTIDHQGAIFPSSSPPMRVHVDTTKPTVAIRADVDEQGRLVISIRIFEEHLDPGSAELRLRTDRGTEWREVDVPDLVRHDQFYEAEFTTSIPACREVALVLTVRDQARNEGEATFLLTMPRTAQAEADLRLASMGSDGFGGHHHGQAGQRPGQQWQPLGQHQSAIPSLQGAMEWRPDSAARSGAQPAATGSPRQRPGQLTSSEGLLLINSDLPSIEELPLPAPETQPSITDIPTPPRGLDGDDALELSQATSGRSNELTPTQDRNQNASQDIPQNVVERGVPDASSLGQAYHCQSRAFSLDYSVEALGASALSDIELWGTEDGGRQWSKWGSDPDRQSPFDVQVGNDGLFGFRMVVVGSNGIVSNRPKDGDPADVWINIDTTPPSVKISRAVYGEGPETGMLVIDYQCSDSHLVENPVSIAYSESPDGPWNTFVSGLKNTGIYLWKASPSLPDRIYVKVEVVDKAGNVGSHRLDLPIDTKGLAPRGRIHGFRPIH
jgi:hypothetical protein